MYLEHQEHALPEAGITFVIILSEPSSWPAAIAERILCSQGPTAAADKVHADDDSDSDDGDERSGGSSVTQREFDVSWLFQRPADFDHHLEGARSFKSTCMMHMLPSRQAGFLKSGLTIKKCRQMCMQAW